MRAAEELCHTDRCVERIRHIDEAATLDPYLNLEREAAYMKSLATPSYRLWRSTDSVVLGRFLKPEQEVRLDRARNLNVPVVRRPSGGGAVFHDLGNINYSMYLPEGRAAYSGIEESLRALSFPVTELLDTLGVPWSWKPPNNIYVLGGKISGSAQARSGGLLLHHGTLLVNTDLVKMCQLLKPGGRSRIASVINLSKVIPGITAEDAASMISEVLESGRRDG